MCKEYDRIRNVGVAQVMLHRASIHTAGVAQGMVSYFTPATRLLR